MVLKLTLKLNKITYIFIYEYIIYIMMEC